jgi:SAM-dependent methyltransferase
MDQAKFLFSRKHELFFNFLAHTTQDKNTVIFLQDILSNHFDNFDGEQIHLIDVGCGYGIKTVPLLKNLTRFAPVQTTALDPSKELLDYFQQNFKVKDVEFVQSDWETYTPKKTYDVILSVQTFYYIKEWEKSIRKMLDTLNPGGILCLSIRSKDEICIFKDYFMPKFNDGYSSERNHQELCATLDDMKVAYSAKTVKSELDISDCLIPNDQGKMLIEFMLRKPYQEIPQEIQQEINHYLHDNNKQGKLMHEDGFIWIVKK